MDETIPNTGNLIDYSPPEHTAYLLPERASCKDADALVLAMDYIENHLSRCRFQLFLEQLVEAWPENMDVFTIYFVKDSSFSNGYPFKWKGFLLELGEQDEQGNHSSEIVDAPEFWELLHNAAYPEDDGFLLLVNKYFGPKHHLTPISREKARELIDEVIPEHARAKLERHRMDAQVDQPNQAGGPAPRM